MTWEHRTSRHARGYGRAWEKLREYILSAEPLCRLCAAKGRVTLAEEVDHIRPKADGGGDEIENLQPICRACHRAKGLADRGAAPRKTIGRDGWPTDE